MTIHHSNTKCDVCGYRHSPGNTSECLDCVLAQTSEDQAALLVQNDQLKADVKRLRLILACVEPDIKRLPNCEERDCHPDCLVRQLFEALAATKPNGTGAGAPDAAKAVGPQRLGPASANDTGKVEG